MITKKDVWILKSSLVITLLLFNLTSVNAEMDSSAEFDICYTGANCGSDCSIDSGGVPSSGCGQSTGYHNTDWDQLLVDPQSGLKATIEVLGPVIVDGITVHEGSPGFQDALDGRQLVEVEYYTAGDFMDYSPLDLDPPPEFPADGFYYKTGPTDWHFVSMGYSESINEFENLPGYSIGVDNYAVGITFEGDSYDKLHDVYKLANIE